MASERHQTMDKRASLNQENRVKEAGNLFSAVTYRRLRDAPQKLAEYLHDRIAAIPESDRLSYVTRFVKSAVDFYRSEDWTNVLRCKPTGSCILTKIWNSDTLDSDEEDVEYSSRPGQLAVDCLDHSAHITPQCLVDRDNMRPLYVAAHLCVRYQLDNAHIMLDIAKVNKKVHFSLR